MWKMYAEWSEGDNKPRLLEEFDGGIDEAHAIVEFRDSKRGGWPEGCDVVLEEPTGKRWRLSGNEWVCEEHDYPEKSDRQCGVRICTSCGEHKGLARCFCGWARDGGNGAQQLRDAGENIDDEG